MTENKPQKPPEPELTREQINWKRKHLTEHLDVLLQSLAHAMSEYHEMKESFELNPPKRKELEVAIETMDLEIEQAKKELTELNRK